MPEWLKTRLVEAPPAAQPLPETVDRGRNPVLWAEACALVRRGWSADDITAALVKIDAERCKPPKGREYVEALCHRARARYVPVGTLQLFAQDARVGYFDPDPRPSPEVRPLTDVGNRDRLIDRWGHRLRYCPDMGSYLVWDGIGWQQDAFREATELAIETVAAMVVVEAGRHAPPDGPEGEEDDRLVKWAFASQSRSRLEAMVELAKSAYPLRLHVDDLDQRPWLFTAANGTIDLTTGQPVASDPTNLITRRANAAFAPQARCPRWERFIGEIFAGQDEVVRFAQEFLGYSLTGSTTESIMLILHGQGSNGKSVMLEVISHVLGSYAQEAAPTAFIVQRNTDTLRNDLAMLRGARLVTAMETSETARLDMATVKRITGGDRITARFLHQEFFSYVPQFKLLLATNAMPEVTGADTGTWRRLGMLPFSVQFGQPGHPPAANKERLAADLKQEAPGILNWLVQGCLRWQQQGLSKPTEVAAATADYRDEQDLLAAFVDDCIECGAHLRTLKVEAYVRYVEWAEERRMRPIGRRVFSQQLAARGFTALRTGQAHYWAGFALKTTPSTFTVLDGGLR